MQFKKETVLGLTWETSQDPSTFLGPLRLSSLIYCSLFSTCMYSSNYTTNVHWLLSCRTVEIPEIVDFRICISFFELSIENI